jgi:hypothetical protein
MGNFIFGYDFVAVSAITSDNEDSDYPIDNVLLYNNVRRHFRNSDEGLSSEIVLDMGSAKALTAVVLYDVNFTQVIIEGNSSDSWSAPPFSQQFDVFLDERTGMYKRYIELSGFNYRYLKIGIEADEPTTDGVGYHRIGAIVPLDTTLEFTYNPSWPYEYSADDTTRVLELPSGNVRRVKLGERRWKGTFEFNPGRATIENDLWVLNRIEKNQVIVFFENINPADSDQEAYTGKVYLVYRNNPIGLKYESPNTIKVPQFELEEVY